MNHNSNNILTLELKSLSIEGTHGIILTSESKSYSKTAQHFILLNKIFGELL